MSIKLDRVNSRIASEQKVIDRAERQLENLDKALERYVELGAVSKGLDRRESQEEERLKLTNMVNKSQEKIDEYLDQKSEYTLEIKNFEVEVGPLKYISALLYGDDALTFLENAVRWVILILVFVFFYVFLFSFLIFFLRKLIDLGMQKKLYFFQQFV